MTNQFHPYEPLTSQNAALVLVDHQVGLMTSVRDYSTGELKWRECSPVQYSRGCDVAHMAGIDDVSELAAERFQGDSQ
jgi:hypothetical protein